MAFTVEWLEPLKNADLRLFYLIEPIHLIGESSRVVWIQACWFDFPMKEIFRSQRIREDQRSSWAKASIPLNHEWTRTNTIGNSQRLPVGASLADARNAQTWAPASSARNT
jgi:hypothetical protein